MSGANFIMKREPRFEDPTGFFAGALRTAFVVYREDDGKMVGFGNNPEEARIMAENTTGMYITFGGICNMDSETTGAGINAVEYMRMFPPVPRPPITLDDLTVNGSISAYI